MPDMPDALDRAWDRFAILLVRDPVEKKWLCAVVDGEQELLPGGTLVYSGQNRDDAVNYAVTKIVSLASPPCASSPPEASADAPSDASSSTLAASS
jgi:hypothetical protein